MILEKRRIPAKTKYVNIKGGKSSFESPLYGQSVDYPANFDFQEKNGFVCSQVNYSSHLLFECCAQHPRIMIVPSVVGGTPKIKNTTISIPEILRRLSTLGSIKAVVNYYGGRITEDDIKESLSYSQVVMELASDPSKTIKSSEYFTVTDVIPENYLTVKETIEELATIEDEDFRPTKYALEITGKLLDGAVKVLGYGIGDPDISPDGENGICVDWENGNRMIRLVIPSVSTKQGYIYYEEEKNKHVSNGLTDKNLCAWLKWLNNA